MPSIVRRRSLYPSWNIFPTRRAPHRLGVVSLRDKKYLADVGFEGAKVFPSFLSAVRYLVKRGGRPWYVRT
jgi:hypothetical protein